MQIQTKVNKAENRETVQKMNKKQNPVLWENQRN